MCLLCNACTILSCLSQCLSFIVFQCERELGLTAHRKITVCQWEDNLTFSFFKCIYVYSVVLFCTPFGTIHAVTASPRWKDLKMAICILYVHIRYSCRIPQSENLRSNEPCKTKETQQIYNVLNFGGVWCFSLQKCNSGKDTLFKQTEKERKKYVRCFTSELWCMLKTANAHIPVSLFGTAIISCTKATLIPLEW